MDSANSYNIKKLNLMIYVIFLLGIFLRIIYLEKQSIWLDEMTTILVSEKSLGEILSGKAFNNHTPPLYYVVMHFWGKVVPLTEFGLRFPSVMFDILNMFMILLICKELINKEKTVLVLSAYALSPFMIYYSQEGRMYTMLVLFILLFSYSMLKLSYFDKNKYAWAILSGLTLALGTYTHYYMILFAVGSYSLLFYHFRKSLIKCLVAFASGLIALIIFSPWVPIVINLSKSGGQQFRKYTFTVLPYTVFRFLFGYAVFPLNMFTKDNFREEVVNHSIEIMIIIVACILAIKALKKSINGSNKRVISSLFWVIGVPVLLSVVISLKSPMLSERYLIIIYPFLIILFIGFINFSERSNFISMILIFSILIFGDVYYYKNSNFGKAQWRDVGLLVTKTISKNDIIIVEPHYAMPVFQYYFNGKQKVYPDTFVKNTIKYKRINGNNVFKEKLNFIHIISGSENNTNVSNYLEKFSKKKITYRFPLETGITCTIWIHN